MLHTPPSPPSTPPLPFKNEDSDHKPQIHAAIILTCSRPAHLVELFGTVASDFTRMLSPHFTIATMRIYDGCSGIIPTTEELSDVDLLLLPGSFHMVTDQLEWMVRLEELIRRRKCWIFGVCFGMQLACKAYGGEVAWNPNGVEVGVAQVNCDYAMMAPCEKERLTVLQSHDMHITKLPPRFEVMAWNEHTAIQACVSLEHRVMGVQFHPDFARDYFHYTRECRKATLEQADLVLEADFDHDVFMSVLQRLVSGAKRK